MKIVVNTDNYEILNSLIRTAKVHENTILIAKLEKSLFEHISEGTADAYIITSGNSYVQRAIDFIKKHNPYIPVVVIANSKNYSVTSSDMLIPFEKDNDTDFLAKTVLHNIYNFNKNFEKLQKLTVRMDNQIPFGEYIYDPIKRTIYHNTKVIHKLSPKQAGIFELLISNFGQVVNKNMILEKVWRQSNYFVGRSLDVFVTHLRKILKDGNVNMTISNVSNIGLMIDYIK